MNETEFDKYVRNLLQNAEEEVSPGVWEGVQAGLKHRRVVPFFKWAGAAVAAAAAVLAGVVFLQPARQQVPAHSNSTISILASAPEETTVPQEPVSAVQAAPVTLVPPVSKTQAPLLAEAVAPPVPEAVAREEEQNAPPADAPAVQNAPAQASAAVLALQADANAQLNSLAFAQEKTTAGRGFSIHASANLQANQRGDVGIIGPRPYAAPPLNAREGIYNEAPETSFRLPFSVGVGIKYNFTPRWALGTGIRYTNLGRTFVGDFVSGQGFAVSRTDIDNQQHWIGVPLNAYYDIVNKGSWRVHVYAGGSVEWLVDNDFLIHNTPKDLHYHQHGSPPQWSVAGGLGVEYRITEVFGLYLDPSFRYYIQSDLQPRSLRTIQPLRFDLEAGVRFNFGAK